MVGVLFLFTEYVNVTYYKIIYDYLYIYIKTLTK